MRDFRDAKSMAQTLRASLADKALAITHSESLEITSRMLGIADWNTLAALLKHAPGASPPAATPRPDQSMPYPAIPIRDFVPFPSMTFPLFVGREKTKQALEQAFASQRDIVLAVQRDSEVNDPGFDDLHEVGTLASVLEVEQLADETLKVLVQVHRRVAIIRFLGSSGAYQAAIADLVEGPVPESADLIREAAARFRSYAAAHALTIATTTPPFDRIRDPGRLADVIVAQMILPLRSRQALLATLNPVQRLQQVHDLMDSAVAPPQSAELEATLARAHADAVRRRHKLVTLEHLLLALAEDVDVTSVLATCHVNVGFLQDSLAGYLDTGLARLVTEQAQDAQPSEAFARVLKRAGLQAWETQRPETSGADILVAMFEEWRSPAAHMLVQQRMTQQGALAAMNAGDTPRR